MCCATSSDDPHSCHREHFVHELKTCWVSRLFPGASGSTVVQFAERNGKRAACLHGVAFRRVLPLALSLALSRSSCVCFSHCASFDRHFWGIQLQKDLISLTTASLQDIQELIRSRHDFQPGVSVTALHDVYQAHPSCPDKQAFNCFLANTLPILFPQNIIAKGRCYDGVHLACALAARAGMCGGGMRVPEASSALCASRTLGAGDAAPSSSESGDSGSCQAFSSLARSVGFAPAAPAVHSSGGQVASLDRELCVSLQAAAGVTVASMPAVAASAPILVPNSPADGVLVIYFFLSEHFCFLRRCFYNLSTFCSIVFDAIALVDSFLMIAMTIGFTVCAQTCA